LARQPRGPGVRRSGRRSRRAVWPGVSGTAGRRAQALHEANRTRKETSKEHGGRHREIEGCGSAALRQQSDGQKHHRGGDDERGPARRGRTEQRRRRPGRRGQGDGDPHPRSSPATRSRSRSGSKRCLRRNHGCGVVQLEDSRGARRADASPGSRPRRWRSAQTPRPRFCPPSGAGAQQQGAERTRAIRLTVAKRARLEIHSKPRSVSVGLTIRRCPLRDQDAPGIPADRPLADHHRRMARGATRLTPAGGAARGLSETQRHGDGLVGVGLRGKRHQRLVAVHPRIHCPSFSTRVSRAARRRAAPGAGALRRGSSRRTARRSRPPRRGPLAGQLRKIHHLVHGLPRSVPLASISSVNGRPCTGRPERRRTGEQPNSAGSSVGSSFSRLPSALRTGASPAAD